MAPPSNRRPGYSRRAQYSTFFSYLAGIAGAIVGAALLVISLLNPQFFSGPRGIVASTAEPVGAVASRGRTEGKNVIDVVKGYILAGNRYSKIEQELEEAKIRLAELEAAQSENRRLKQLLGLRPEGEQPVAVTRLTSSTASSTRRFATIGAGSRDGVARGMPVRSRLGLIGRVLEVSGGSSRVLLISDTESLVPVRRSKDGVAAFAQGRGDGTIQVKLIDLGINPLKKGDVFVTSGSGGLYRPGTAMAVVMQVTRDGASARALSDPAANEYVVVEPIWAPEANESAVVRTDAEGQR